HQEPVADTEPQSTARAAFTYDHADDRHFQPGHFNKVACNGFTLPTFFGRPAGISAFCIDETDDRTIEFIRLLHESQSFSVAIRMRHAEIALYVIFRITSALMTDDCDRRAFIGGDTADNRCVIAVCPVSKKFDEVIEHCIDVFKRRRAVYISRNLDTLPWCQVIIYFVLLVCYFLFKKTDFLRQIQ